MIKFIALILFIIFIYYLLLRRPKSIKTNIRREDQLESIAKISGPGKYNIDVVGESFYQEALSIICGGKCKSGHNKIVEAYLYHEDNNPHDDKAIRIDIDGMTVGHLSKKLAREFRKRMEEAGHPGKIANCSALIVGGWRGPGDEGHFGVKLDLPKASSKRKKDTS